jgi:hypothetical protein
MAYHFAAFGIGQWFATDDLMQFEMPAGTFLGAAFQRATRGWLNLIGQYFG